MALVNVVNISVLDNPTCFLNPFQFEITFECLQALDDDLEWAVIYVGSAQDSARDLVLDEILVGPVPVGLNKFVLSADAPSDPAILATLPPEEVLGVTVVLVTCSYRNQEFVRIGFYVNNEYWHPDYMHLYNNNNSTNANNTLTEDADKDRTDTDTAGTDPACATLDTPADSSASSSTTSAIDPPPSPSMPTSFPVYPNIDMKLVQRHILADKPRVTKFPIAWSSSSNTSSISSGDHHTSMIKAHPSSSSNNSTGNVSNNNPSLPPFQPQQLHPPFSSSMDEVLNTNSMDVLMEG